MATVILTTVSICALIFVGVLFVWSPGTPQPFLDETGKPLPGSISEKIYAGINGVQQGMFIKGKNRSNPLLLYLHGGMPDYFLTQQYPTGLENDFTVVWWEQRGSGISYRAGRSPEAVTTEQLIADVIAVTNYLRQRFGQEKIYLMGHSGGTFIGIQAAARAPELYHAYIGVAQVSDQLKSEYLLLPRAKSYLDRLKAPEKGFYTFDKSAHSPLFEEPEKMRRLLREAVLKNPHSHTGPARR